ncbi:MAG: SDR family oxidoreductase [Polycyclovorans sp.]
MTYRSVFKPDLFKGQTHIVTGGGSGIGRCTAHELASLGAQVAIVGRKIEKLEAVKAEIESLGGKVSCHVCDIREEATVKQMIADVIAQHGAIHALVNNAGGQNPSQVKDLSVKGWEAVIRNNLTGGFIVAREAYNQWMAAHGGSIVNIIADIWGGMPTMAHTGAARAGMLNFTESAACEWAQSDVRVNAVAPGWIASSGFDTYDEAMQAELRRLKDKVPLGRYGNEAEVSAAITFLLSPGAAFITGSCIRIDGGVPNARHTWAPVPTDRSKPFDGFPLSTMPKCLS